MLKVADLMADAKARVREASLEEFRRAVEEGGTLLIDIRDSGEIRRTGMVPGSHNVPRGDLEWRADPECNMHFDFLVPETPVIVFSSVGERSPVAGLTLMEMGYRDVATFNGGTAAWIASGGRMEPVD